MNPPLSTPAPTGTPGVQQHCLFMKVPSLTNRNQSYIHAATLSLRLTTPPLANLSLQHAVVPRDFSNSSQEIGDGIALRKRILANLETGPL